jgi:hypothetical protein
MKSFFLLISFLMAAFGPLYGSMIARADGVASSAQPTEWVSRNQTVSISDLPPETRERPPANLSDEQYASWLASRPTIVLDGSTLVIGKPGAPVPVIIRAKRIELRNGARIITNGSEVELDCLSIHSESGEILSFSDVNAAAPAADGAAGQPGQGGGRVIIDSALERNDVLSINLPGQKGQDGGGGRAGGVGGGGARGDNAADHLFDCAHGGGNGGRGLPGLDGETGRPGGAGGSGGSLVLKGKIALQTSQIEFSAPGGTGGQGGRGGPGGPGGPGGQGGSGSTYCRGGGPGPVGPAGNFGQSGPSGENGKAGSIK